MSEAEQVKLCVECKHYEDAGRYNRATLKMDVYHSCNFPRRTVDVVTGGKLIEDRGCYRSRSSDGFCGHAGRFWEAK